MSLAALKTRMRDILAVGTSLDSQLDGFVQDAIDEFETAVNLPYMKVTATKEITKDDRVLTLTGRPKGLIYARTVEETDEGYPRYRPISIVQEWQAAETGPGEPMFAWQRSQTQIEFDLGPELPLTVEVRYWSKSTWPLLDTAPPFTEYQRYILAQAIYEASESARKTELGMTYKNRFSEMMIKLQIEVDAQLNDSAEVYMGGSV